MVKNISLLLLWKVNFFACVCLCVCRWSVKHCPSSPLRKPTWCCCHQNMRASVPSGRSGLAHSTAWRVCFVLLCMFVYCLLQQQCCSSCATSLSYNVCFQCIHCLFPLWGDIQSDIMQRDNIYLCLLGGKQ